MILIAYSHLKYFLKNVLLLEPCICTQGDNLFHEVCNVSTVAEKV